MIAVALDLTLAAMAVAILVATLALIVQALGIILRTERPLPFAVRRPSIAVLVPAHNEAAGIAGTIHRLRRELQQGDTLLVVADNCTDKTAQIVKDTGAKVLIRKDIEKRGKGFALAAGLASLELERFDVVVFVDADCRFSPGGLVKLARACLATGTPIQCRNLMTAPPNAGKKSRLGVFASRLRNDFRPSGYARLGLPCQLFGTGMAMPAPMVHPERFATGHITEDLLIGLECALAGSPPRYLKAVSLHSHFPVTVEGCEKQKQRWIHGHLSVIGSHVPELLRQGFSKRSLPLLALAFDVLVPPLTLLIGLHGLIFLSALMTFALTGGWIALAVATLNLTLLSFALVTGWHVSGRKLLGTREFLQLPGHAGRVALSSLSFALGKRSSWVRAERVRH
jgi:cellulose synthase/poly-beta-1,6-N-acetylglucosamine synthase-like glycosyltransferase